MSTCHPYARSKALAMLHLDQASIWSSRCQPLSDINLCTTFQMLFTTPRNHIRICWDYPSYSNCSSQMIWGQCRWWSLDGLLLARLTAGQLKTVSMNQEGVGAELLLITSVDDFVTLVAEFVQAEEDARPPRRQACSAKSILHITIPLSRDPESATDTFQRYTWILSKQLQMTLNIIHVQAEIGERKWQFLEEYILHCMYWCKISPLPDQWDWYVPKELAVNHPYLSTLAIESAPYFRQITRSFGFVFPFAYTLISHTQAS